MNILAVDTSSIYASCAIKSANEIKSEIVINNGLVHSKSIMPMIENALLQAQLDIEQIDLFAVCAGPGSFTGVRIGVCAIKGLATALNKPCVQINTLDCLAANVLSQKIVCPIMDARRGQVYCAAYLDGKQIFDYSACAIEELCDFLQNRQTVFVGDGIDVNKETILNIMGPNATFAPPHLAYTRASAAAYLAQNAKQIPAEKLSAIYLRRPQAEREYANKHA